MMICEEYKTCDRTCGCFHCGPHSKDEYCESDCDEILDRRIRCREYTEKDELMDMWDKALKMCDKDGEKV